MLYRNCYLFVFPSWHEGFGLPVLEAMKCNRAVIGSNKSSIPEIIVDQMALFDPHDITSIPELMQKALTDSDFHKRLVDNSIRQTKRFSWESSARALLKAYTHHVKPKQIKTKKLRRLAIFSPFPPIKSGISTYTKDLIRELSNYFNIDVIVDDSYTLESLGNCKQQIITLAQF